VRVRLRKTLSSVLLAISVMANATQGTNRVTVEAEGRSFDEAKHAAFTEAIEQSLGVLIVGDLETNGKELTKDFTGQYSAGYVTDYEVIEKYTLDDKIHLKVNVEVSSSKIANRMLLKGKTEQNIDGLKLEAMVETQMEQRQNGDAILSDVLESYPENALIVNSGETELKISRLRKPYLELGYTVNVSRFWTEALVETLDQVAFSSSSCNGFTKAVVNGVTKSNHSAYSKKQFTNFCGTEPDMRVDYKASNAWISSSNGYYFSDLNTLYMVNQHLQSAHGRNSFGLLVELTNASGDVLDHGCFQIPSTYFVGFEKPRGTYNLNQKKILQRPVIQAQQQIAGKLQVGIDDHVPLDDVAGVRMLIRKSCGEQ